jgi:ribonucleoside-diphosphate reductase alpha chain
MSREDREALEHEVIGPMKFIPAGRYLYYAGRAIHAWNNCFAYIGKEDTREEWGRLNHSITSALMMGGGVGVDYSIFRPAGRLLERTGGTSSGPIPLACIHNEIGRYVMQGGSRRSALYGSLAREHDDIEAWLYAKNWHDMPVPGTDLTLLDMKSNNFNYPAPLDMMNTSVNYGNEWLALPYREVDPVFAENTTQAMRTGNPGFSFNFKEHANETGRNACAELTTADDSDVCNLGSINFSRIETREELRQVVSLAAKFLICGSIRSELPDPTVRAVREKNRRIGLGIMGLHEWLLKRGLDYEVGPELRSWLNVWQTWTKKAADEHCDRFYLNHPIAYNAIAPAGTIGMLAGTTTGIEPLYAVAFKRRYLVDGVRWMYSYVVDPTAELMLQQGVPLSIIEDNTALALSQRIEQRISFQADVQGFVDMGISSTVNLPAWGQASLEPKDVAKIIAKYAPRLRGLTFYPDGAVGGQPITAVPYEEARKQVGVVYEDNGGCASGVCGV